MIPAKVNNSIEPFWQKNRFDPTIDLSGNSTET
jgi:hypothetical protein